MSTDRFSMRDAVRFGWETLKANLLFFFGILIVVLIIVVIPDSIGKALSGLAGDKSSVLAFVFLTLGFLFSLASSILWLIVQMGFIRISLNFYDGTQNRFADLLVSWRLFFRYLFGSILYGLVCFGGIAIIGIVAAISIPTLRGQAPTAVLTASIVFAVLFIALLPLAVIWAIKYQYFGYLIIDRGLDPVQALKTSAVITNGVKADLFLFGLLMLGINFLGALALMIGLFVTIPISLLAYAFVYRRLSGDALNLVPLPAAAEGAEPDGTIHPDIDMGIGEPSALPDIKPPIKIAPKSAPASAGEEARTKGLFLLFYRNDYEGAIEEFTRAIGQDAKYAGAYHSRGLAYFKSGEFHLVLKDFNEAIDLDRSYAETAGTYVQRGLTYEKLSDRSQALKDLRMAVALGNKDAQRWLNWLTEESEDR